VSTQLQPKPYSSETDSVGKLINALKYLSIESDSFGNVAIYHKQSGSQIVFTTQGDVQVHAARDVDAKTGRWYHVNSDVSEILKTQNQVLYGPRGEILTSW